MPEDALDSTASANEVLKEASSRETEQKDVPFLYLHRAHRGAKLAKEELWQGLKHVKGEQKERVAELMQRARSLSEDIHRETMISEGRTVGLGEADQSQAVEGTPETAEAE